MTAQELKAAILDLAIRGKLVPQDPSDEPAEKLLERVAAKMQREGRALSRPSDGTRLRTRRSASLPPITDDEKPFALPNGWAWCRLGEMVDAPITYGIIKLGKEDQNGVKVLRSSDVKPGRIVEDKIRTVTKSLSNEYARTILSGGEVVINVRGTLGGCACVPDRLKGYNVCREVAVIRNARAVQNKYLMWILLSEYFHQYLVSNLKGIAYKGLNIGLLVLLPVPLPPLAEQKRIVARIEELMPWVERYAVAEEKRGKLDAVLPGQLKQSILKVAFSGALVADGVGVEKPLDSVCAGVFTGNSLSDLEKRKFTRPDGLPFIGTKDVGFDQVIAYDKGIRIPKSEDGYRIAPKGSTLLCVEGGSSGRKIGLLTEDVRFGNKLCAFVPGDGLDSRYLFLFLQSPQFLEQFAGLQNGPRKGAGVSQVKGLLIPLLPLSKQKSLVRRIDEFLSTIQTLSAN